VTDVLTVSEAEHIAMLATRAPSVHNTQPWRLVMTPYGLDVRADRNRRLQVLDPLARQLLMSCGAVVHHVEVAAHAMGLDAVVALLPDPADEDLVARVTLTPRPGGATPQAVALAKALLHRATSRRRFADTPAGPGLVDVLRRSVEAQGSCLGEVRGEDRLLLDVLVQRAEHKLLGDEGYRRELAEWVFDPARDGERSDGLPVDAVDPGDSRAEDVPGREFLPRPDHGRHGGHAEHPTLLVLTTDNDAPLDWVRAGLALSALLLEATRKGLVAQPLGQVTDIAYERSRLRAELGLVGIPQLVLRVGQPAEAPRLVTPRRAVDDVLTRAQPPRPRVPR
jgi:nitroreductase